MTIPMVCIMNRSLLAQSNKIPVNAEQSDTHPESMNAHHLCSPLDKTLKTLWGNRAVQESKHVSLQQSLNKWKGNLEHETDPEKKEWLDFEMKKK